MGISVGDTPRNLNGTNRKITITYPTPQIFNSKTYGLSQSDYSTGTVSTTITKDMLPSFSSNVVTAQYVPQIVMYGSTGTVTDTLYYRIYVNGVSKGSGSKALTVNQYWSFHVYNYIPVNVGDTIAVSMYVGLSSSIVNMQLCCIAFVPTRIKIAKDKKYLADVTYEINGVYPDMTTYGMSRNGSISGLDVQNFDIVVNSITATATYPLLIQYPTYGVNRINLGDTTSSFYNALNATTKYFKGIPKLQSITFRPSSEV